MPTMPQPLADKARRFAGRILARFARRLLAPLAPSGGPESDPYHRMFQDFIGRVNAISAPTVLEIGARARSGNIYTQGFAQHVRYRGMDIIPGPNVDLVADVHQLGRSVTPGSYDAIFSISVFEHLAMPWQAALEINAALKPGGLVFISTHPVWPLHDRPWDFYRYSTDGFRALFHRLTGFEILEATEGLPCRIIPLFKEPSMRGLEQQPAFLGVSIIARKIGTPDPRLRWDIPVEDFLGTEYPV